MTFRAKFRAIRLYYKSHRLFRQALKNHHLAWWLPLLGCGTFYPRSGDKPIHIPQGYWTMLPTACRLLLIGAYPEWEDDRLKITYNSFHFVAPAKDKSPGIYLKEIFIDDVYKLRNHELHGMSVLDIGANIGDSSIAFASRGARVHACEPLPTLYECLQANIVANGMQELITMHPVGLSTEDRIVKVGAESMHLVNAMDYLKAQNIGAVDWLKLDCEGCEYELLGNQAFLDYLQPMRIALEYHHGGEGLYRLLTEYGYEVQWPKRQKNVGYLYAERRK